MAFVPASYWDVAVQHTKDGRLSNPSSTALDGARIASGKDFSDDGQLTAKAEKGGRAHASIQIGDGWPVYCAAGVGLFGGDEALTERSRAFPAGAVHHFHAPARSLLQAASVFT